MVRALAFGVRATAWLAVMALSGALSRARFRRGHNDAAGSEPPAGVFTAVPAGEEPSYGVRSDGTIGC